MKRRIIELENNNKELEEKNKTLFQVSQWEEQEETILASDVVRARALGLDAETARLVALGLRYLL